MTGNSSSDQESPATPFGEETTGGSGDAATTAATSATDASTRPQVTTLPRPVSIGEQSWPEGTAPLVSICCTAFNHGEFIRDCIEGFLIQETTFPVEIIIHDDASTDDTVKTLLQYQAKVPQLFRLILQKQNQYSLGTPNLARFVIPQARGKYLAICEGDDYWTDPTKLQKQVEFLELNPEYVITYHDARIVDEHGNPLEKSKIPRRFRRDLTAEELRNGAWTLTLTRCFRNVLGEIPPEYYQVVNRDIFMTVLLSRFGAGKYMNNIEPAVYRRHSGGIWSGKQIDERNYQNLNTYIYIYHYLRRTEGKDIAREFLMQTIVPHAYSIAPERQIIEARIAELERQLKNLRASRSLKLGQSLTEPIRRIRSRLRRK